MEIEARQFNSDGIEQLKRIMKSARHDYKNTQAAKFTSDHLEAVTELLHDDSLTDTLPSFSFQDDKKFANRFELGKYLFETIPPTSAAVEYENVGFWSWITALYIDQLLEPNKGGKSHKLWSDVRYITEERLSKRRYYRHLCFLPYWVCKIHPIETAEFFLMLAPYVHSEIIEQIFTAEQSFAAYPGMIEVAKRLYIDPQKNNYRPNTTGRLTGGSAWRLANVICKQLQLNYDLHVLSSDQIWDLLPKEFNGWKRLANKDD